uniref:Uncharacterized protein n=1 Tax=Nelumbo nucifera TaxID=4432 RepID=A0A822ZMJ5_NELNU|nr:TPA_asm: hypothetical protein HUJ06_002819 [Nelumbo nucifera]
MYRNSWIQHHTFDKAAIQYLRFIDRRYYSLCNA